MNNRILRLALCIGFAAGVAVKTHGIEISNTQAGVIARVATELLSKLHFSNNELDDARSQHFLEKYLDHLDPRHMVFLDEDVQAFRDNYGGRMFEFIKRENAQVAFTIFARYIERLKERTDLAHKLIDKGFDFSLDEFIQTDRSKEPWPSSDEEVAELWRKRVKDEFLRSKNSKDSEDQIREKLHKRYRTLLNMLTAYDNEEILQTFLGALGETFDPHSSYMSPTEAKNFEIQNIDLSFFGIARFCNPWMATPRLYD
ncbi:MAG: hypothetical protein LR011_09090 [Verrucomicrobia bacterium]|nr:hypothetical protein [Verrucomicrobiota bacterium]